MKNIKSFWNYIKENNSELPVSDVKDRVLQTIKDISEMGKSYNGEIVINDCIIEVKYFDKSLWISSIISLNKRNNAATGAMVLIKDAASKNGVRIRLNAQPFGNDGLDEEGLIRWYTKLGFSIVRGNMMECLPQNNMIA